MLRLKQAVLGSRGKLFATILLTLFISVVIAGNNAYANGCGRRFLATLEMTPFLCHSERSEESPSLFRAVAK
jgi:hypothetical protein